jgi:hypothetical protein
LEENLNKSQNYHLSIKKNLGVFGENTFPCKSVLAGCGGRDTAFQGVGYDRVRKVSGTFQATVAPLNLISLQKKLGGVHALKYDTTEKNRKTIQKHLRKDNICF